MFSKQKSRLGSKFCFSNNDLRKGEKRIVLGNIENRKRGNIAEKTFEGKFQCILHGFKGLRKGRERKILAQTFHASTANSKGESDIICFSINEISVNSWFTKADVKTARQVPIPKLKDNNCQNQQNFVNVDSGVRQTLLISDLLSL